MTRSTSSGEGEAKTIVVSELLGRTVVEFCYHALEQMKIRGISEKDVLAVIRYPDETGLPTQGNRDRVRKYKRKNKAIDVVYELRHDRILVVTAFPRARN